MIPEHYARDIVERCDTLIESLLPVVMQDPDGRFGGPLGFGCPTAPTAATALRAKHGFGKRLLVPRRAGPMTLGTGGNDMAVLSPVLTVAGHGHLLSQACRQIARSLSSAGRFGPDRETNGQCRIPPLSGSC
jgi:hypothetical protein